MKLHVYHLRTLKCNLRFRVYAQIKSHPCPAKQNPEKSRDKTRAATQTRRRDSSFADPLDAKCNSLKCIRFLAESRKDGRLSMFPDLGGWGLGDDGWMDGWMNGLDRARALPNRQLRRAINLRFATKEWKKRDCLHFFGSFHGRIRRDWHVCWLLTRWECAMIQSDPWTVDSSNLGPLRSRLSWQAQRLLAETIMELCTYILSRLHIR